ncbi:MAG TPA: DUF4350 domain-containing protein [Candidatus Acidoferrales bacterium]|jgi:hypothetical protein|nr:DUF4350 domain-containing protein [Candidatus Acidoferrales bacterium]
MLKRPVILCAGLLFAAVFVFGLVHLFDLRLDQGDIYPPYSTLRADPLGASVIYESLEQVPGVTPSRYFDQTFKVDDGPGHALFVLGTEPDSLDVLSRTEFDTLQRFVFNGGRVVIAYYPQIDDPWSDRYSNTNETDDSESGSKKFRRNSHRKKPISDTDNDGSVTNLADNVDGAAGTNGVTTATNSLATDLKPAKARHDRNSRRAQGSPDDEDKADQQQEFQRKYADLSKEWGYDFTFKKLGTNADGSVIFPQAVLLPQKLELPPRQAIHTSLCFTNLTNGWATIYQRDKKTPVVIERKFGAGTVVLVADSYPFSNEAMFKDRSASLISWMLGGGREVIFEEAHLGIVEQPGMASLMRRYQLHGLIFSLIFLSGLFVWKNAISLVPPHEASGGDAGLVVAGRDSASGFVNLVRRSISPAEIINVCFAEWKKSGVRMAAMSPEQRRDLEQLIQQQAALDPNHRKPVENYRVISQILKRRH